MNGLDHMWVLICACFVFFMQAGFVCYEVGFVQSKNVISVAIENIIAFVVAALSFFLVGFAFMFGKTSLGLIGTNHWFLSNLNSNYDYVFIFYQMMFAGTSVTIFSGSMSERTKLKALVIAAVIVGTIIYPVFGHWVWGGVYMGQPTLLSHLGYTDYAGATVIHSTAGWIALAGTIVVGPRKDRWDKDGKPKRLLRSNIPFATLGTFILWFSWFGFNGGNLLRFEDKIGLILLNTNFAASAGVIGAVVTTYILAKDQSMMESIFSGALGGLVAITAGSDILTPVQSIFVGFLTGSTVVLGSLVLMKLKIDDTVNAVPIHAFGGTCGVILCGAFQSTEALTTGRTHHILIQILGAGINFVWAFGVGFLMFYLIKKTVGIRVSEEEEEKGLNIVEFSDYNSWMQHIQEKRYENLTQDLNETIEKQNIILKRQAYVLAATQEKEREKIARDLHDGVGQSLVALKINLGLIHNSTKDEALKEQTSKTIKLADSTIEEIRNVMYNLKPVGLNQDGLAKSIRNLCNKLNEIGSIRFNCKIDDHLPRWDETVEMNIYRIIQESLTNIIKHSGGTEAYVNMLILNDKIILLRISDNGSGFDISSVSRGIGLNSIRERADMISAALFIESEKGVGTRIIMEVPYEKNQGIFG
ncbi:ammonium transporter [Anaerotignum sp.]|uniref:ammonium transporter n=1 Tax=Anaerotignum sp. TaxID=2039241 RepID=UPI00271497C9|nr:ammonium transporter [Anaerotignum sp.]